MAEEKSFRLRVDASVDELQRVLGFVEECICTTDCPPKAVMQINVSVEEIFVNIAHYAYTPGIGEATIRVELSRKPSGVEITFIDRGVPYDPLAKPDPDVTLSAKDRKIGGLGIFMVKKSMDEVKYEYLDGCNVLTIKKGW